MTEQEWEAANDPGPMIEFLGSGLSERRLRLFTCACLRRIESLIPIRQAR